MKVYAGKRSRATTKKGSRKRATARAKKPHKAIAEAPKKRAVRKAAVAEPKTKAKKRAVRKAAVAEPKTKAKKRAVRKAAVAEPKTKAKKRAVRKAAPEPKTKTKAKAKKRSVRKTAPEPKTKTKIRKALTKAVRAMVAEGLSKKRQARTEAKTKAKVSKISKAEQAARGRAKTSKEKRTVRAEKKRIEDARRQALLVKENLPRKTPKEKKKSIQTQREKMLSRFKDLLEHARETGQVPTGKYDKEIDSAQNTGEQRFVRIERVLDLTTVEAIVYKVRHAAQKLKGRFMLWYGKIDFSSQSEYLLGSGEKMLDTSALEGPKDFAEFFQVQGFDNTGLWNTRQSMLVRLESLLEDYATKSNTIVFLHGVLIKNFDRKVRP